MTSSPWDRHYVREKSKLRFPDENLLRLLKHTTRNAARKNLAIDLGCGSGRHLPLLMDEGYGAVVGMDISMEAMLLSRDMVPSMLVRCDNRRIPLKDGIADLVLSWGSLHYAVKDDLTSMLAEIYRILADRGTLLVSLRSSDDSYMKRGRHIGNDVWITDLDDISGSTVSFYREEELREYFSAFGDISYGFTKRSLVGMNDSVIAHWVIRAVKSSSQT